MTACLDAWAMLEWLHGGEPARTRVLQLLERERPLMSWINLGEVAYVLERRAGAERAAETIARLRGRLKLDSPSPERVLEAAALKASHAVSYADAFAVATAKAHGAVLVTGDPEILAGDPSWQTEDLRG
ncbi:MAG: type II toxin-antitoxin system VapC family toxin [Gaiellaceae bacterium]